MVQKRSFYGEEICSIPCKHPRQVEYNNQQVSISEFVSPEVGYPSPHASGECGLTENGTEVHDRHATEIDARFPTSAGKDIGDSVTRRSSISSSNFGCNEEIYHPEIPVYVSCPSVCFSPERPFRTAIHCEDIYSLLLRYPPRKAVPIGSDHQADIPEWSPLDCKTRTKTSGTPVSVLNTHLALEKDENRLMGACVIPMPDEVLTDMFENIKIGCCCLDEGSIGCVRQHIAEARNILEKSLGKERFEKLGFRIMGEQVAEKWSEEEEQLFHDVVFSNPLSLGKNFWNYLSAVFPSRTKKEIVCYYFNVFMLRRRAEQNRCESMNTYDSDDDEWLGSDDYGDNEPGMTEEDEDSSVESPIHQDDYAHNQSHTSADYVDIASDRDVNTTCESISFDSHGFNPNHHLLDKLSSDRKADQEVQDDSCTSSDPGVSLQETHDKAKSHANWSCGFNGSNYKCDQHHVLEPSNVKLWDDGHTTCPKIEVDFLPTFSMIEEVFGDGSSD